MPISSLIPALIGSAISNAIEAPQTPPPAIYAPAGMLRTIPGEAKMGEMSPPWQGQVTIGGTALSLAPGAQIRSETNMIVMPAAIQQPVVVRYQTDTLGLVSRVWILTPTEIDAAQR